MFSTKKTGVKKDIEALLLKYETLDVCQKQVIEIKALIFELRTQSCFGSHIKSFNILLANGTKLNTGSAPVLCRQLAYYGFLDSKKFNVLPELRHIFSIKALSSDNPRRQQNLEIAKKIHSKAKLTFTEDHYYEPTLTNQTIINVAVHSNESLIFQEKGDPLNDLLRNLGVMRYLEAMYFQVSLDKTWLESRHDLIKGMLCCIKLRVIFSLHSMPSDYKTILECYKSMNFETFNNNYLLYLMGQIDIALGDISSSHHKLPMFGDRTSPYYLISAATQLFLKSDYDSASDVYKKALAAFKKFHRKRTWFMHDIHGIFYLLIMLYRENKIKDVLQHITSISKQTFNFGFHNKQFYDLLGCLAQLKQADKDAAEAQFVAIKRNYSCQIYKAFYELVQHALDPDSLSKHIDDIKKLQKSALKSNALLAAHLYDELLKTENDNYITNNLLPDVTARFLDIIEIKADWEYKLDNLEGICLGKAGFTHSGEDNSKRMLWLLDPTSCDIEVIEQSLGKSGWSKGRSISLKRLYSEPEDFDYLTLHDRQAIRGLKKMSDTWYYDFVYAFSPKETLIGLIGHPCVYHKDNRSMRLELIASDPEIYIEETAGQYHVNLSHAFSDEGFVLEQENINRYKVITFTPDYENISKIIPSSGLTLPAQAKNRVIEIIQHVKKDLNVHSGIDDVEIPEVEENLRPVVQILPIDDEIQITLWVRPFGDQGPYCKAGHGKKNMIATIFENDIEVRKKVKRNYTQENDALKSLLSSCPSMNSYQLEGNVYLIDDLEDILESLSELEKLKINNDITIEWPEGEKYKIKKTVSSADISLNISSGQNWFEFDGEVKVSDEQVLKMQNLLELVSNNKTRFVSLKDGEFIELTASLRKQLKLLSTISDGNKISKLGASSLVGIAQEIDGLTTDTGWEEHLAQIQKMKKHNPRIPSTLQANLRDYQEDGYKYLSRLAHWGIGACLADDMGLGKTIQSIALILEYAKKGATLIIAPTSVCFNWTEEIKKFAPTLNVYSMYDFDRNKGISQLKKMDVLICSYGLLHHNVETLSKKNWQTIVIDEAQAIKNPETKRWRAVMKLNGKVRVALTGTPIENHLGELWSISNFINPGMLGSQKYFQNNYALPIESHKNTDKLHALKSLINPYILRRLKSDVLTELPPKTEQTIYIEPSTEEKAFYEALRKNAMQNIATLDGNNRLAILAEISKLRQACCDSSLVNNQVSLENSKLKEFQKTLVNIIENGHKVLVFSQYVRFLAKIQKLLQTENIVYQYIDGTTPHSQRKKNVESFQSGSGDVFLLSLKAGGSGLNLTAADYVIHLDPWWNPAVEDQASDRAHRIGQERPVTIYRFIMKDTIEDKIIKLHQDKRNLANDLLGGQDMSGKMTEAELINLISG